MRSAGRRQTAAEDSFERTQIHMQFNTRNFYSSSLRVRRTIWTPFNGFETFPSGSNFQTSAWFTLVGMSPHVPHFDPTLMVGTASRKMDCEKPTDVIRNHTPLRRYC